MKGRYITKKQKDELITLFSDIEKDLVKMEEVVGINKGIRDSSFMSTFGGDLGSGFALFKIYQSLQGSLNELNQEEYKDILEVFMDSHGVVEMLESIESDHKSYLGSDMLLHTTDGGQDIKINLSAALRFYENSTVLLDEKESLVSRLEKNLSEKFSIVMMMNDEK